ncbi:MAG TPA: cellulose binding domain-containing protein [Actinophytocola sp.]|uniref:glycoside hydrolase family 18 protein n=1 Tax=Actinophytocola sp. TaxID=1872138 RepID=UPI002DDD5769|nr:cellulose binding domain-containing protein [Actinophytocola sp.]HEV2781610.1 cellulose binding domain-containing protein [Actinophytocola sp.]
MKSTLRKVSLPALAAGVITIMVAALMLSAPAGAATTPTATFGKDSTWATGYTARYTVTAADAAALNGWRVEFDLASGTTVGAYWDALLTTSGTHYTFVNREYNGSVAAGASVSFGFNVDGTANPTNCRLNGQPCGGGAPPTTTTTRTTTTTTPTQPPPPPGTIRAAPYIDITMSTPSLVSVANATGHRHFTLAFALGDHSGCNAAWGGTIPINDARIVNDVRALRASGGDVVVATGGAVGPYLEHVCGTADALLAQYKRVLDTVGGNHLDVDVEASIPHDMVNTALVRLQRERGTSISYTMRVQGDDFGMDPYSITVLQNAAAKGLNVLVNPMTMEFGSSRASWGDAVIAAAESSLRQLRQIWPGKSDGELKRMLGVTPMIGRNFNGKIFTQAHARQLVGWATTNHIGLLAFWSVGRDNGGCPGGGVSATCSGISQSTYEFTNIFKGFRG